jgi:hypothetical protein
MQAKMVTGRKIIRLRRPLSSTGRIENLTVEWEVFQRATPYDLRTSGHQFRAHLERWRDNGRRQLLNQLVNGGIVQGL